MVVLGARAGDGDDGRVLAIVRGGVLLNQNLPFIDHINRIVYPEGSLPFGSQGTATLFLDDVRITTNVRLFKDERAIGTRVSQAVSDAVLRARQHLAGSRLRRQRLVRLGLRAAGTTAPGGAWACCTSATSRGRSR